MTKKFRLSCLPVLLLGLFVPACSTSPLSRIDANRAAYESWPIDVQDSILNGQAKKGMTPEQVEMALGKPSQIVTRGKAGEDEIWVYKKGETGSSLLNNTGVSLGGGIGGLSVGSGGRGRSRPTAGSEGEVVFEKGIVVRSDAGL